MPEYRLPDLQYDYGALEPHISGKIMELHHDKHHKNYVEGANHALEELDDARDKGISRVSSRSSARSRSTSPATSFTPCSGRTWRRRRAVGQIRNWPRRSTATSEASTSSRSN